MIAWQSHRDLDSGTTAAPHVSVSASRFDLRELRSSKCRSDHIAFPKRGTATIKCRPSFDTKGLEWSGQSLLTFLQRHHWH